MNKNDSLKCISYLSDVIGLLAGKWERPHTEIEVAILQQLHDVQETIRKAYEAEQPETAYQAMETALQVLSGQIVSLRTELLVIKALVAKESAGEV